MLDESEIYNLINRYPSTFISEVERKARAEAIDDFAKKLVEEYDFGDCRTQIYELAEQLKAR